MQALKATLFVLILLISSNSAFARGGASADCNGDGVSDISCTGALCTSNDEGAFPGSSEGYCSCARYDGTFDTKKCSDRPSFSPTSHLNGGEIWQELLPLEPEASEGQEPDPAPSQIPALSETA